MIFHDLIPRINYWMSPSIYQSGQLKNCYPHIEKQGARYLRFALYNATKYVCQRNPIFSAYLATKRAECKPCNIATSHTAKKLVRLIFAMKKSRQPYRLEHKLNHLTAYRGPKNLSFAIPFLNRLSFNHHHSFWG